MATRHIAQKFLLQFILVFTTGLSNGLAQLPHPALTSIDHVPVVVYDLHVTSKLLTDVLHFKIKAGREHEGIKNCFIKFEDGTYLEFITPTDRTTATGRYYTNALKHRQGGTALAVAVRSADTMTDYLKLKSIAFEREDNPIWRTVSPKGIDLFFIDYRNKSWKDTEINTTHPNGALSLKSTYLLSSNINTDSNRYSLYKFQPGGNGSILTIPYQTLTAGNSYLHLIEGSKAKTLLRKFTTPRLTGICGFEIKVRSLSDINTLLPKTADTLIEHGKTIYFVQELNVFFLFSE